MMRGGRLLPGAALAAVGVLGLACASDPPPRPVVVRPAPAPAPETPVAVLAPIIAEPAPPPLAPLQAALADLGIDRAALSWSPSKKLFAVVVPLKPAAGDAPRGHAAHRPAPPTIAVYSDDGQRLHTFAALAGAAPADLRFLGENRLLYLAPSRAPARASHRAPALRYGLQAIRPGAPAVACTGRDFVFSPVGDHLAWVSGEGKRQRVFADGQAVYPRRGATSIQGQAVWSNDGVSLALLETGAHRRLVVLVEFDNPSGDNSWPLPADATDPRLQVFWAGAGQLVVGPAITKPIFATSFHREPNPVVSMPTAAPAGGAR